MTLDDFSESVLGDPITYAQCERIPESDTLITLPVHMLPSGLAYMLGQSSGQTVLASGTSSRLEVWSSAIASPMDTEDSLLLTTGLHGLSVSVHVLWWKGLFGCESGIWLANHPWFLEFVDVLGGSTRRGAGDGGSSRPATGRMHYVVQSSDTVAVRDVARSDVVGNYVHRHGTGGVSGGRARQLVYSSTGDTSSHVHDGDGPVAPTDGSG